MFRFKMLGLLPVTAIVLALAACGGDTNIAESWSDPAAGPIKFKKVIVFFFSKDEAVRRAAEDELVRQLEKTEGVAAYTLIPETEFENLGKVKDRGKSEGFDGAVIMRLLGIEKKSTYVRGHYPAQYLTFGSYYGYARHVTYDPGYLQNERYARVETNVYSLAEDKLIWSGISETFNPENTVTLVDDVARSVAKDLESKGLL